MLALLSRAKVQLFFDIANILVDFATLFEKKLPHDTTTNAGKKKAKGVIGRGDLGFLFI